MQILMSHLIPNTLASWTGVCQLLSQIALSILVLSQEEIRSGFEWEADASFQYLRYFSIMRYSPNAKSAWHKVVTEHCKIIYR